MNKEILTSIAAIIFSAFSFSVCAVVINTPPVSSPVSVSVDENTPLVLNIVTDNMAMDADGDALTFSSYDVSTPQQGVVINNAENNTLTYYPYPHFNSETSGTDSFTFTVTDGQFSSTTETVTITVNSVNDAPNCRESYFSTSVDVPLVINTGGYFCTDVDGDAITLVENSLSQPSLLTGSSVTADASGVITYTPPAGVSGQDAFALSVTDGQLSTTVTINVGIGILYGNFTMLEKDTGDTFGGTNDVVLEWDGVTLNTNEIDTNFGNVLLYSESSQPFVGAIWSAHHIRVFGPGSYSFDSGCTSAEMGLHGCSAGSASSSGPAVSMTVGAGQIGMHMLFDYNGIFDIDIVNVWDQNAAWNDSTGQGDAYNDLWMGFAGIAPDPTTRWSLVSSDVNGDGINGLPMVDGPFTGFYANFNLGAALPDADSDGVLDGSDNCPLTANTDQLDNDADGAGNVCDAFPDDASETLDADSDGVGDNADAFPNDATETSDSDGDGVGDNADAFPLDPLKTTISSGSGGGGSLSFLSLLVLLLWQMSTRFRYVILRLN